MDRRGDLLLALAVIALGVFIVTVATGIDYGLTKDWIGPRAFFYGIGVFLIVGGAIVAGRRLINWNAKNEDLADGSEDEPGHPASGMRAGVLFLMTLAYALLLQPLGYIISTPLYFAGGLILMKHRNWRVIASTGIGFTAIFYLLFATYLSVRLPLGPLHSLFRQLGWVVL